MRQRDRAIFFDVVRKHYLEVTEALNETVGPLVDEVRHHASLTAPYLAHLYRLYKEEPEEYEAHRQNEPDQVDLTLEIVHALYAWADDFSHLNLQLERWAFGRALEHSKFFHREEAQRLSVYIPAPEHYEEYTLTATSETWASPDAPKFSFELMSVPRYQHRLKEASDARSIRALEKSFIKSFKDRTLDYDPSRETRAEADERIPYLLELFERRLREHFDAVQEAIEAEGWKPVPKKRARTVSKLDHYFWLFWRLTGMTNKEIAEVWTDQETRDKLLRYVGEVPPLLSREASTEKEGPELLEAEKAVSKAINKLAKSININPLP